MNDVVETPPAADVAVASAAVDATPPHGPGHHLREARLARGLSVTEVAHALKFGARQIEALEADDYSMLSGATFLRGFVRSYARFLKMDATPLLGMLESNAPAGLPDVRPPQNMGVASTQVVASRRTSSPMLVGAAVLGVIALALGVWHFVGGPAPSILVRSAGNGVEKNVKEPVVQQPEARVESAATPAGGEAAQPVASVLAPDMRQLIFVFEDKSWVEAIDAEKRVLLKGEYPGGSRQAVAGKPPFQLVIGNAAKVSLQYDEKQVDLKPHTRAEVARLTLE